MIDTKYYEYNYKWMIQVIDRAVDLDPYLQGHPEIVEFLKTKMPKCKPLETRLNPDGYAQNVNFYFVDKKNSKWLKKSGFTIYGEADLIIDIMQDDSIGSIEVWLHQKMSIITS